MTLKEINLKVAIAAALCLMSLNAFAGEHGREGGVNINLRNDPRAYSTNTIKNDNSSSSFAVGNGGDSTSVAYGGQGGQGGNGGISSSSSGVIINETHPDKITVRQVAAFGVADVYPTAHCMGGSSATLSTGFFGIGGATSYINEHCVRQELARYYAAQGRADVGDEILCKSKFMKGISVCGAK